MLTPAAERTREEKRAELLISAGWYQSDMGWHHRNLNGGKWPWPSSHATRLTREADKCGAEDVHRMLRGEVPHAD